MIILVTGSNGLVGKNFKNLIESNFNGLKDKINWIFISSKDADLTIYDQVDNIFNKYNPTHVINLAAYVGGLYKNMRENVEFFENNMLININVMKCCHKYNIKKLISVLSTCIFPDIIDYPITEDKIHKGPPHFSNIGYSYSKRMIDILSNCYNNQYNTNFISIIPGNLYGPYDNFNINDGHVIPSLVHKCHTAKLNNLDLIINGTGKALRQFTYVEDLIKLIIWTVYNYNDNEPIILSSNEQLSISDVVDKIVKYNNFNGNIIYDTTKSDGQYKKTISNYKLLNLYPDFKFTSFDDGIKKTIDWFNINYNTLNRK